MTPLGRTIRKLRSSLGMSLEQHATLIGVSHAYLSALEHGHRGVPTDEMLQRIVGALQISQESAENVLALIHISRPKVKIDTAGLDPMATELANRLAYCIGEMTENELERLLQNIRRMDLEWNDDQ